MGRVNNKPLHMPDCVLFQEMFLFRTWYLNFQFLGRCDLSFSRKVLPRQPQPPGKHVNPTIKRWLCRASMGRMTDSHVMTASLVVTRWNNWNNSSRPGWNISYHLFGVSKNTSQEIQDLVTRIAPPSHRDSGDLGSGPRWAELWRV